MSSEKYGEELEFLQKSKLTRFVALTSIAKLGNSRQQIATILIFTQLAKAHPFLDIRVPWRQI